LSQFSKRTVEDDAVFYRLNASWCLFHGAKLLKIFNMVCDVLFDVCNNCDKLTLYSVTGLPRIPDNISDCEARLQQYWW